MRGFLGVVAVARLLDDLIAQHVWFFPASWRELARFFDGTIEFANHLVNHGHDAQDEVVDQRNLDARKVHLGVCVECAPGGQVMGLAHGQVLFGHVGNVVADWKRRGPPKVHDKDSVAIAQDLNVNLLGWWQCRNGKFSGDGEWISCE